MAYLGKSPSQGVRNRYYFTASGGETSISGALTGGTLTFTDGNYVDVNLNGVTLVAGTDYNTSTANTIAGLSALTASDVVEIVVYDVFSVFSGNVNSDFSVGGNLSVTGTTAFTGATTVTGLTTTGDINFGDNDKASFSSGKLQIYHDGTNAYIDETFANGTFLIRGNNISLQKYTGETMIQCVSDGKVELNFNNVPKLETTSSGVDVTGTAVTDGLTVAGNVSVDGGTIKLDGNYPTGTGNVALGDAALDDGSLSSNFNTALGHQTLTALTSGGNNTAVGAGSGESLTTGQFNAFSGRAAGTDTSSGSYNSAFGASALGSNTTASNNTAVGYQALTANTTGANNVAIGYQALDANTTASNNTAVGYVALGANTTGENNVATGNGTLDANTTGDNNVAMGNNALGANTTADNNVAVGHAALNANTTGTQNTAVGQATLDANTTANYNTGIGGSALGVNTTGSNNTSVGWNSLQANTTGANSTAIGYRAGYSQSTNGQNMFAGVEAGYSNTGYKNCFIGYQSGDEVTSGNNNTILGSYNGNQSGLDIRTSNNNIVLSDGDGNPRFIINSSGRIVQSDGTSTAVASGAYYTFQWNSVNGPYQLLNSTNTGSDAHNFYIFQRNGSTVGTISVTNSATTYATSSDYRLKENVVDMTGATERLKQLNPVSFNFIADADTTVDGFLAHEVQDIVPEATTGTKDEVDADGNAVYQGIDQSKLVPLLTAALQEALTKIDALEARIATLEAE